MSARARITDPLPPFYDPLNLLPDLIQIEGSDYPVVNFNTDT